MRVLVCGGRDYNDINHIWSVLEEITTDEGLIDTIIHGGATGADTIAGQWAYENCKEEVFYADWKQFGKFAGHIRNKTMLVDGKPDLVIAFPGGKGTANMIKLAQEAGVKVVELGTFRLYVTQGQGECLVGEYNSREAVEVAYAEGMQRKDGSYYYTKVELANNAA